ncbi:MAG: FAD/NAD(P)-binding oxidoreductase [Gracilimonas sp.]|nr:FAD/NAD(P)-binding oxidoreductase [Gracilimonas sp.]
MKKTIAIIGSSFAGYTAAIHLSKLLAGKHQIIVVDEKPEFLFLPSFMWYPFTTDKLDQLSFDTRPVYRELGIEFIERTVYGFDLEDQLIYTSDQDFHYDYLLIATGARPSYESIKGLKPPENAWSICCDPLQVDNTRQKWNSFLSNPGPIVVGAAQWAGYFFAAYEFLFNMLYDLHKEDILEEVPIHFVTSEPYLTHFGVGGLNKDPEKCEKLFDQFNIKTHLNAEIQEIKTGLVQLGDRTTLESDFTMIIPPFTGINAVKTTRNLADAHGFINVTDQFNHPKYPNVFAAGGSVSIPQRFESKIGVSVPRTHSSSERMAKTAATNIAAALKGHGMESKTTDEIYDYIRSDMEYLSRMIFQDYENKHEALALIAKGSQEKWTSYSLQKYKNAAEQISSKP